VSGAAAHAAGPSGPADTFSTTVKLNYPGQKE
jgi:hypothetical protein